MLKSLTTAFALALLVPVTAHADVLVAFDEGAPKDRFTFRNSGSCPLSAAQLVLDLSTSRAGLIFDVTASGAGVEVFQPLDFVTGSTALRAVPKVRDGDNRLTMDIATLAPGETIAFTIDVDDTLGGREITVSDAEIAGARVSLTVKGKTVTAPFTGKARATLESICP
ncbi:MAG: aggregation factor core [Pseudomonadota bacterium]